MSQQVNLCANDGRVWTAQLDATKPMGITSSQLTLYAVLFKAPGERTRFTMTRNELWYEPEILRQLFDESEPALPCSGQTHDALVEQLRQSA
ncbi:MAG: hypothetical protein ABJB66_12830 [Gemmatimonadaceae bacterium]